MTPRTASLSSHFDWTLKSYLVGLVCLTTLISFGAIAVVSLGIRIPIIERETRDSVVVESKQAVRDLELMLQLVEQQVRVLAEGLRSAPPKEAGRLMRSVLGEHGAFAGMYVVDTKGRVVAGSVAQPASAAVPWTPEQTQTVLPTVQRALSSRRAAWNGHHVILSGGKRGWLWQFLWGKTRHCLLSCPTAM